MYYYCLTIAGLLRNLCQTIDLRVTTVSRWVLSPTDGFDMSRSGAGNMQGSILCLAGPRHIDRSGPGNMQGSISCLAGDIYEMMRNKKSCSAIQY